MQLTLNVNGTPRSAEVEVRTLLSAFIREHCGLTGTHVGCDTSQCGCCTVLLDGQAVKSCSMLAVQAEGFAITTIEGLAPPLGGLHPVQAAFTECHALQCGFCTPGMVMSTVSLLQAHPQPSDQQIAAGLAGNLCRCTGYINIARAVKQAAHMLSAPPAATADSPAATAGPSGASL